VAIARRYELGPLMYENQVNTSEALRFLYI